MGPGLGVLGQVLAHWWAEVGSGVVDGGLGVSDRMSAYWWARLVPEMAGYGVQGVPKLVLAYQWVGPNPRVAG